MSFIHRGSNTKIYGVFSGNKLDSIASCMTVELTFQNWSIVRVSETHTNHVFSHLTGATLQDNVIAVIAFKG